MLAHPRNHKDVPRIARNQLSYSQINILNIKIPEILLNVVWPHNALKIAKLALHILQFGEENLNPEQNLLLPDLELALNTDSSLGEEISKAAKPIITQ